MVLIDEAQPRFAEVGPSTEKDKLTVLRNLAGLVLGHFEKPRGEGFLSGFLTRRSDSSAEGYIGGLLIAFHSRGYEIASPNPGALAKDFDPNFMATKILEATSDEVVGIYNETTEPREAIEQLLRSDRAVLLAGDIPSVFLPTAGSLALLEQEPDHQIQDVPLYTLHRQVR